MFKGPLYQNVVPDVIKVRFDKSVQVKSADYRIYLWRRSFPIFLKYPFGVGLGRINLYKAGCQAGAKFNDGIEAGIASGDNTTFESSYLDLLYSLGFVGLGTFLCTMIMSFVSILRVLAKPSTMFSRASLYFGGALFVWLFSAITSSLLFQTQPIVLLILILVSINYIKDESEDISDNSLLQQ